MEKIIFENDHEKHVQLSNGYIKIIKKNATYTPKSDFWVRIPQKWWRQELKGLNPIERCLLISIKLTGPRQPTIKHLARELNISKNTAKKYLRKLKYGESNLTPMGSQIRTPTGQLNIKKGSRFDPPNR